MGPNADTHRGALDQRLVLLVQPVVLPGQYATSSHLAETPERQME
jgi:hypothetical protein